MNKLFIFFLVASPALTSCSKISNKSVFEKLSTEELSKAIKSDTAFAAFYEKLRKSTDGMSDIKKAKYSDVTYRRLFKYIKFINDTIYWKPLTAKWEREWNTKFAIYLTKADSALDYWHKYTEENSLKKYVSIELSQIDKRYYEYIGELKEVSLGFKLTPLQGTIEQIRFTYGYKPKINGDNKYYEKHSCISTSPFSSATTRFWEVAYSDMNDFSGKTVETFLRDYNLYIEITSVRKDGINIETDEFAIPQKVTECFENEKDYPALFQYTKEELIKDMINKDYVKEWEYKGKKEDEIRENKDKLCFDFLNDL